MRLVHYRQASGAVSCTNILNIIICVHIFNVPMVAVRLVGGPQWHVVMAVILLSACMLLLDAGLHDIEQQGLGNSYEMRMHGLHGLAKAYKYQVLDACV